jgi:hypothetical protein
MNEDHDCQSRILSLCLLAVMILFGFLYDTVKEIPTEMQSAFMIEASIYTRKLHLVSQIQLLETDLLILFNTSIKILIQDHSGIYMVRLKKAYGILSVYKIYKMEG